MIRIDFRCKWGSGKAEHPSWSRVVAAAEFALPLRFLLRVRHEAWRRLQKILEDILTQDAYASVCNVLIISLPLA